MNLLFGRALQCESDLGKKLERAGKVLIPEPLDLYGNGKEERRDLPQETEASHGRRLLA
jgi:hypothetical protein